jgi:hypothetical protein
MALKPLIILDKNLIQRHSGINGASPILLVATGVVYLKLKTFGRDPFRLINRVKENTRVPLRSSFNLCLQFKIFEISLLDKAIIIKMGKLGGPSNNQPIFNFEGFEIFSSFPFFPSNRSYQPSLSGAGSAAQPVAQYTAKSNVKDKINKLVTRNIKTPRLNEEKKRPGKINPSQAFMINGQEYLLPVICTEWRSRQTILV